MSLPKNPENKRNKASPRFHGSMNANLAGTPASDDEMTDQFYTQQLQLP
jgi:hypothetical protein